jgi:N-acyl-D-amino-acid deacylase
LLPGWAQAGGVEETLGRLTDPAVRARARHALEVTGSDGHQGLTADWSTIVIAGMPGAPRYDGVVGRSVADAARGYGVPPSELYLDLVAASRLGASCLIHVGIEEHVRALMRHPRHTVGSDGILVGSQPHPRAWGTFARMLGHYVRDEQVLDLVTCVRHMTSAAADRIGATDRGRLVTGALADIVVFDPETVADRATYERPREPAIGVDHVLVNGTVAVRYGVLTGVRAGRVLRRRSTADRVGGSSRGGGTGTVNPRPNDQSPRR